MPDSPEKQRVICLIRGDLIRMGRHYRIDLDALDLASLNELQRLLRDLEDERRRVVQQARRNPWR